MSQEESMLSVQQGGLYAEKSLEAVLNNYMELMELWEWSLDICKDTKMNA